MRMIPATRVATRAIADSIRTQPTSPGKVEFAWKLAVGAAIARFVTVSLDSGGTLTVISTHALWSREIGRSRPVIARRLDDVLGSGVVKRIEITTAPDSDR